MLNIDAVVMLYSGLTIIIQQYQFIKVVKPDEPDQRA
jgi:hypothetical protein